MQVLSIRAVPQERAAREGGLASGLREEASAATLSPSQKMGPNLASPWEVSRRQHFVTLLTKHAPQILSLPFGP